MHMVHIYGCGGVGVVRDAHGVHITYIRVWEWCVMHMVYASCNVTGATKESGCGYGYWRC